MSPVWWTALCLTACLAALPVRAAERPDATSPQTAPRIDRDWNATDTRPIPDDQTLIANGAVIGDIIIRVTDIFDTSDPAEDKWTYHAVNKLHLRTRPSVVQKDLLFHRGERYTPRQVAESERILRSRSFFYDAHIQPVRYNADNTVDLLVQVRDVWTLRAGANFNRSGGRNNYVLAVEDANILGTGKEIRFEYESTVDRSGKLLSYRDPNVLGSRVRLDTTLADNSDGDLWRLDVGRRFFSLDSRWAAGLKSLKNDRLDRMYDLGQETGRFRHQVQFMEVSGGISNGIVNGNVHRWTAGATYQDDKFGPATDFDPFDFDINNFPLDEFGLTDFTPGSLGAGGLVDGKPDPLDEVPQNRKLVFPWIGFEWVQDGFTEMTDMDRIGRTEDLNLGHRLQARLGYSSEVFGGVGEKLVFNTAWTHGSRPAERHMLLKSVHAGGRWGEEGAENVVVGGSLRYYWRNTRQGLFFVELTGDVADNLDPEKQLLIGGDSGLRGYPLRYQDGDRRFRFTVEQRFFSNWHPFRLARVGAAVFFDMGRAWFHDPTLGEDLGLLKDVGLGLRLSSSRGASGGVTHLDVAFPLDGDTSIKRVQWLVTTRETF